jgi:hypothetical protein
MMVKKSIAAFLAVFYLLVLPLHAYAGIIQEAEMILRASGKAKVASTTLRIGQGFGIARLVLGLNLVVGAVSLGFMAYDLYNHFGDNTQGTVTMLQPGTNPVAWTTNSATITSWGKSTSWGCLEESYTHTWDVIPNCAGYQYGTGYFVHTTGGCTYRGNPAYELVGMHHKYSNLSNHNGYTSCPTGNPPGSLVVEVNRSSQVWTAYMPVAQLASTATYTGTPGTDMGTSPSANYQTMEATKADALSMIAQKLATWDSWASQYGKDASGTPAPVPAPYQNVTNILQPIPYVPVTSDDYDAAPGATPGDDDEPLPVDPTPDDDGGSGSGDPPETSDGTCTAYEPENNWNDISGEITAAMANIPVMGLVNKLSSFSSGSSGTPHTINIEATAFTPALSVNLDDWYFNEVLAIMRWAMLAGAFIVSWRIAVGGGS